VTCTRPTLGVTTAPAITLRVHVFTDGKNGTICNSAVADSAETDPTPANDMGTACVELVDGGGACNSLDDLLLQVEDGNIKLPHRVRLEQYLETTIAAANAGQRNTVIQRLSGFNKQVGAARSSGACDAKTADSLTSCASVLRQQYVGGSGKPAARK
jgi:hypothetical protein